MTALHHNWADHITFSAARYRTPTTVAQLQEIVRHASKVGIVGGAPLIQRHCRCNGGYHLS